MYWPGATGLQRGEIGATIRADVTPFHHEEPVDRRHRRRGGRRRVHCNGHDRFRTHGVALIDDRSARCDHRSDAEHQRARDDDGATHRGGIDHRAAGAGDDPDHRRAGHDLDHRRSDHDHDHDDAGAQ
jgi:hypothetical protein